MLRLLGISILALATASCCFNETKPQEIVGCYDLKEDPPGPGRSWPALRLTDEPVEGQHHKWKKIVSIDPERPFDGDTRWRFSTYKTDHLFLAFIPKPSGMSDQYGSAANLETSPNGFSGTMVTSNFADRRSQIELTRRPCGKFDH